MTRLLLLLSFLYSSLAFPDGIGNCLPGRLAIERRHTNNEQVVARKQKKVRLTTGSLGEGSFQVTIDGILPHGENEFLVQQGVPHTIMIDSIDNISFKGIFVRLEPTEPRLFGANNGATDFLLQPLFPEYQDNTACTYPVLGFSHRDDEDKYLAAANFWMNQSTDIVMDITVVLELNETDSVFYSSRYKVGVVARES